jgi:4-amino-4-deoxy-L-arabinose transferase-like glycosyltransferase
MMLGWGAVIVLAIVVPWYAALHARHGWDPIWAFFVGENVGRYTSAMTTDRGVGFFVGVLFGDILLPWAPLLLVPIWTGGSQIAGAWRGRVEARAPDASIRRLLWLWIVVVVGAFSFSASKEDLYILPVAPAAAALIADALAGSAFGRDHRGLRAVLAAVCVLTAILGGLVFWILGSGYYRITDAPLVAGVLMIGGLGGLALWFARRPGAAFRTLATAFVAFNFIFVLRVLPGLEPLKPVPVLADTLASRASPGAPVAFHNLVLPSLVYYLGRPVVDLPGDEEAVRFVTDHAEPWVVTGDGEWGRLRERVPGLCIAVRHPRFDARLPDILRRAPPPDVLLVTKCK